MFSSLAEIREFAGIATEALSRYKLRTALSVLGVVLGVAAVIAMISVSEGAAREALAQVEALGLDNLVARSSASSRLGAASPGLTADDAEQAVALVPLAKAASPLIERHLNVEVQARSVPARVIGVRATYQDILRLGVNQGRFLSITDERAGAAVCVLGASLAKRLFVYRDPIGQKVRIGERYYEVVGVLGQRGGHTQTSGTLGWRDIDSAALVPLPVLSGRTLAVMPHQRVDEVWLQVADGKRVGELAAIFARTLARKHGGQATFEIVVPRELLAQRYRTQRIFSVVVGSVAALALLVGGIGIMNIMLTSVVERTREIGVRRTVGATRTDVTIQFLIETLMMTLGGGALGIAAGSVVSWGITAYAGWSTHLSAGAVVLGLAVSLLVGLIFGFYPAVKASRLEPVDALRYE